MNSANTIYIKDQEGKILKSFSIEDRERAFDYLKDLELWGIEATLSEPSLPETLINALGASEDDVSKLKDAINEEIADHEHESCAFSVKKND